MAALWVERTAAVAGALVVWNLALWCVPKPGLVGGLLALTGLAGLLLLASACVRLRSGGARAALADAALGLGAAGAAAAFLLTVLANQEEELAVVRRAAEPEATPKRLRLIDFNVLHGFPDFPDQERRFQRTLAAIQALEPDILVLQETWDTPVHGNMVQRLGEAMRFNSVYARANGSRRLNGFEEGSAVLSRFPIRKAQRWLLAPRFPWWERRIALATTLEIGGQEVTLVGLHCHDANEEVAAAQARSVLERLPATGPVLVAGDFNAGSESAAVTQFTQAGFVEALPGAIDHVLLPGQPWGWQLAQADWTLRPEDLGRLIGERVEISDHAGIVVDLVPRGEQRR
jgi:endonuclease/exonuclease/phosphatase family metal-dependent hydrolase